MEDIAKLFEYNVLVDREEYKNLITTQQRYALERKKMRDLVESEASERYNKIIQNLKDTIAEKDLEIEKTKVKSTKKCMISIAINVILIASALLLMLAEY